MKIILPRLNLHKITQDTTKNSKDLQESSHIDHDFRARVKNLILEKKKLDSSHNYSRIRLSKKPLQSQSPGHFLNKQLDKSVKEDRLSPYKKKLQFPIRKKIFDSSCDARLDTEDVTIAVGEFSVMKVGDRHELIKNYLVNPKALPPKPRASFIRNESKDKKFKLSFLLTEEERKACEENVEVVCQNGAIDYRYRRVKRNTGYFNGLKTHKRNLSKTFNVQDINVEEKLVKISTCKVINKSFRIY
jgi:hypothetical protein